MNWTQEQYDEHLRKQKQIPRSDPVVRLCAPRETGSSATAPPKKSKHGNIRTEVYGIKFDSKLEARYYKQLMMEWRCGDVMWFERQRPFDLEGGVRYVCDFVVVRGNKEKADVRSFHVYDCKGDPTQESLNKIKQVKARYGIKVELIKEADIMAGITA